MAWDVRGQLYKHGLAEKKLKILRPDGSICNLNRRRSCAQPSANRKISSFIDCEKNQSALKITQKEESKIISLMKQVILTCYDGDDE